MATKMKCPGKVVDGKCIGNDGKEITAPYVSEKGALYPDQKSLISGCAENPTSSKCQKVISGMTPEQRAKIKGIQRVGGSTKATYKIGGRVAKKKKYGVGGPTTKAQSTPTEQSSQPNTPPVGTNTLTGNPRLKNGGTKTTYKTGGMVNANAKLVATKSAGSKGVKVKVNPKATASNTAKKPSKPRSKAPKKALPKAAYGMSVKGYNMGGGTGDGTQVPYGTQTFKEVTVAAPKKSKGKPKAKYGMAMKGKKSC